MPCCQGTQCGWFRLIQDLDTSLVVFLRGICSGLGPPEGGIVYGLFSKEALKVGKSSDGRTHSPGLVARLTEHVTQEALTNRSHCKPVQFPGALGLDIPFLLSTQHRYGKSMRIMVFKVLFICLSPVGWGCSWRIARKVRIDRTSHGSGCRGHLGVKLLHMCMVRANMFPSFSSFPRDSVLLPEFWIFRVPVFQLPSFVKNIGNVKRKFHDVKSRMRCGPVRRWVQTQLAVRKAGSKRWLRFLNGKSALREVRSEDFLDWEVEQFADALALRSLRAAPGVWRLLVWEQADEINPDCFSLLGSWSIKTRITQRTHAQLYGTMCGILDSIHQVRAPPTQWAELEVPLEAAVRNRGRLGGQQGVVRGSARIFLVPHVTTVAIQAHLDFPAGASRTGCLHSYSHQIYSGSAWLNTGWLPIGWRHSSCMPIPISQIQVFPGLGGSSVLQSWTFVHEKGN